MLNVIIRSVVTIIIGVLLVTQRDAIFPVIIQCIGAAFILPGIIALSSLIIGHKKTELKRRISGPILITSVGSIVLGLWLLFTPLFFVELIMLLLGLLLVLLGLYQTFLLFMSKRYCTVSYTLFIMPVLLVLLGVFVMFKPFGAVSLPFLLAGIGAIIGGISDLISYFVLRHSNKIKTERENNITLVEEDEF